MWSYTVGSTVNTKIIYFDVVAPYTTPADIRSDFTDLSSATDAQLWQKERIARKVINAFCRQSFDFEIGTQYKIQGENKNTLYLPRRIWELTSVFSGGVDAITGQEITDEIEIADDYWIRPVNIPASGPIVDIK